MDQQHVFIVLALWLLCMIDVRAQTETPDLMRNVIYASYGSGTPVLLYGTLSIHYEHLVFRSFGGSGKNLFMRGTFGGWAAYGAGGPFYDIRPVLLMGRKSLRFEVSFGIVQFYDKVRHLGDLHHPVQSIQPKPHFVSNLPSGGLVMRFQKPTNHFIWRVGIDFPQGKFISIGFCF